MIKKHEAVIIAPSVKLSLSNSMVTRDSGIDVEKLNEINQQNLLNARIRAALDDPRPPISNEEAFKQIREGLRERAKQKRQ